MWPQWVESLPQGAAGTFQTLRRMADLVNEEAFRPLAQSVAASIASRLPVDSPLAYASACFILARDFIKYENDPPPNERITGFPALLDLRAGDCDDKVIFLCTLLKARGIACNFVAQSYDKSTVESEGFDHVYAEALVNGGWLGLDPTADGHKGIVADPGWRQKLSSRGFEYRHSV